MRVLIPALRTTFVLALLVTSIFANGCVALNHFGEFREGPDAGPRPDTGRDAFELPDAGAPDAPRADAPVSADANDDAFVDSVDASADANADAP